MESPISKEYQPDLFCHVHVPKTGGTSLNQMLAQWFPGGFQVLHDPDPGHTLRIDELAERLAQRPELRCVSTHHLRVFPTSVGGRRVQYFTILREPLDRTVSLLTFIRKYGHTFSDEHKRTLLQNFELLRELDFLSQWTEKMRVARREGELPGNPVTAMFVGDDFRCEFQKHRHACEAAAAAKCISILSRFLYVGDFACFEQSVNELAARLRALGASAWETDQIPNERVSRDVRGDLGWLEEGRGVVDAYMDGLTVDGMVYRHFAHRNARDRR